MGPIPNDPHEAARFAQLLQDAVSQRDYVDDILRNLPEYTRSGQDPRVPRTSRALARIPIPETTTIPHLPHTYGSANVPVHKLVEQQTARAAEIEILRAAQALNAPVAQPPQTPNRPTPGRNPSRLGRAMNPLMTLLQLALFPSDVNAGEDEELARRRAKGFKP
jgi:hypothetical protein